jgi:hypothetical protein
MSHFKTIDWNVFRRWSNLTPYRVVSLASRHCSTRSPRSSSGKRDAVAIEVYRGAQFQQCCGGNITGPPTSPDLAPLYFSLCGCIKDSAYIPPLPATHHELHHRINNALAQADAHMLTRTWDKLLYRWDISWVIKGSHTEHLWNIEPNEEWSLLGCYAMWLL